MKQYLTMPKLPLIAILRGLTPDKAMQTGEALLETGFTIIEVPINRPGALESIALLAELFGTTALIGAGTVLSAEDVDNVADHGGKIIVSPDTNPEVIRRTIERGLYSLPGAATPTEAFTAIRSGAHAVKVFPSEMITPAAVSAWRAVLPNELPLIPVGGITPEKMEPYLKAGAQGFGIGSPVFTPERTIQDIKNRAKHFAEVYHSIR